MSRLLSVIQRDTSRISDESTESKEALLGCSPHDVAEDDTVGRVRRKRWTTVILLATVSLLAALCSSIITLYLAAWADTCSINEAVQRTSLYSPFLEEVDVRLAKTSMNGSVFTKGILDGPWAGLTTDPVKEPAWDNLEFDPRWTIPLTREQVIKIGKDPSIVAKYDDAYWGLGDEMYIGGLDLFHQIHCLNKIRKAVLDGVTTDEGSESFHRMHIRHCIEAMMQHLLCTGDAGFITFNWIKDMDLPQPDFGVEKQCRDWEQIVQYRDQHMVDFNKYKTWVAQHKPADRVEIEAWDGSDDFTPTVCQMGVCSELG